MNVSPVDAAQSPILDYSALHTAADFRWVDWIISGLLGIVFGIDTGLFCNIHFGAAIGFFLGAVCAVAYGAAFALTVESVQNDWREWVRSMLLAAAYSAVFGTVVSISLVEGLEIRRWAWEQTLDARFALSMNNAIDWGVDTNTVGLDQIYDDLVKKYGDEGEYRGPAPIQLDYPPLRLLIISNWADWATRTYPRPHNIPIQWRPDYEFNRPMLMSNVIGEVSGALAMFWLVRFWIRRSSKQPPGRYTGYTAGLIAAMLLWFNPALIWNSHVFPQWDAWLLAPFLLAVYLALTNGWLLAGMVIGISAMAKGQLLLVTPVLILWPIVSLKPIALLRMAAGFLFGVCAVASPWLINSWAAVWWVGSVVLALALLAPLFFVRKKSRALTYYRVGTVFIAAVLLFWSFARNSQEWGFIWAGAMLVVLSVGAMFLPRRAIGAWACGAIATAAMLCVPLFDGSMAWYRIGIEYGTRHWKVLAWRKPTTLGAILEDHYHWTWAEKVNFVEIFPFLPKIIPFLQGDSMRYVSVAMVDAYFLALGLFALAIAAHQLGRKSRPLFAGAISILVVALLLQFLPEYLITHLPTDWMMPMRYLMVMAFALSLVICAIAITVHVKRRDRRLLIAIAAPWVLMFALLPQMMPRYLVWAAAFSAAAAVLSFDGLLLYLIVTIISWANMARDQLGETLNNIPLNLRPPNEQYWYHLIVPIYPGLGWGVLLLALIWLCLAMIPTRRSAQALL